MQSSGEQWRFWAAVRAEMRATWWGRWRWLWIGLGLVYFSPVAAFALFFSTENSGDVGLWYNGIFVLVAAMVGWPPAWMGSDLLSIRFAGNPEWMRHWRPVEFLARFVGRLVPLLGLVAATMGPFAWATYPVVPSLEGVLEEWVLRNIPLYLSMALAYASVASLASSLTRRPRRWLVSSLVVVGSMMLPGIKYVGVEALLLDLIAPAERLSGALDVWLWLDLQRQADDRYRLASAVFLTVAIVAGLWIWWIAARRYRRSRAVQRDE